MSLPGGYRAEGILLRRSVKGIGIMAIGEVDRGKEIWFGGKKFVKRGAWVRVFS
jgi:hypothetical protein